MTSVHKQERPTEIKTPTSHTPDVVYPAVDGHGDQQLQVEPQSEEGVGLLVADVMDHTGFIQLCLQLVPQIPRNCKETSDMSYYKVVQRHKRANPDLNDLNYNSTPLVCD